MRNRASVILTIVVPLSAPPAPEPIRAQTLPGLEARLQAKLDSVAARPAIPGIALGVTLPDDTTFGLVAGWADTARHVPMTTRTLMPQGSVGKTYFGAVALQLVSEGRLDLDAALETYLGDEAWLDRLPNARDVTVRQLMNHTSGIVRYEFNRAFLEDLTRDPMRRFTPEERLAYLFHTQPPFAPGEGWEYSDTNYILLAMLIERVTDNTAYGEIRRRLLDPGGFHATIPLENPAVPGLGQGYAGAGNPFGGFDEAVEEGHLVINPQFEWGGGGFASTAADLARWTRDVQEGRAFGPNLMDQYRTGIRAPLGPGGSYGLGVIMLELEAGKAWGHSGFWPGYRTEAYYFPDHGFALALQINSSAREAYPPTPLQLMDQFARIVEEELDSERDQP
jgi:D-alanyl-D-alanine carboxypeptidase